MTNTGQLAKTGDLTIGFLAPDAVVAEVRKFQQEHR